MVRLAYQKVYGSIRKEIEAGNYAAGRLLPVESELEEMYGVSRTTIRKAMRMLADEKFVDITQGRGTVVLNRKAEQNFNQVTSVTESLRRRGYEVSTKGLYIDLYSNDDVILKTLKLNLKEKVIRIQRVQCADGKPVCIMTNYIAHRLVPEILQEKPKITSLYSYLEDRYGIEIEWTNDTISASACSFYDAQILGEDVGVAMMGIERICYDKYDKPVCMDDVKILGNWYQIQVTTRGRKK